MKIFHLPGQTNSNFYKKPGGKAWRPLYMQPAISGVGGKICMNRRQCRLGGMLFWSHPRRSIHGSRCVEEKEKRVQKSTLMQPACLVCTHVQIQSFRSSLHVFFLNSFCTHPAYCPKGGQPGGIQKPVLYVTKVVSAVLLSSITLRLFLGFKQRAGGLHIKGFCV